jgi:hypothetical protein
MMAGLMVEFLLRSFPAHLVLPPTKYKYRFFAENEMRRSLLFVKVFEALLQPS